MAIVIPAPVLTACPDSAWTIPLAGTAYAQSIPCLGKLRISCNFGGSSGGYARRGIYVKPRTTWVGFCFGVSSGSDAYVTDLSGSACGSTNTLLMLIDVWGMYRDGLWTSSLPIAVAHTYDAGGSVTISAARTDDTAFGAGVARCNGTGVVSASKAVNTTCVTTQTGTVTVYDDGTLTVT